MFKHRRNGRTAHTHTPWPKGGKKVNTAARVHWHRNEYEYKEEKKMKYNETERMKKKKKTIGTSTTETIGR